MVGDALIEIVMKQNQNGNINNIPLLSRCGKMEWNKYYIDQNILTLRYLNWIKMEIEVLNRLTKIWNHNSIIFFGRIIILLLDRIKITME